MRELFALYLELVQLLGIITVKDCCRIAAEQPDFMTDKIIPTLGYNHLDPGQPGNPKPYRTCGARTRGDDAIYDQCARPAGWGTDHPGAGRCKLHGGSRNPGRYSPLWRGRMQEIARAALEADPDSDPLDLLAELEVQRVILATLIDQLPAAPGAAPPAVVLDLDDHGPGDQQLQEEPAGDQPRLSSAAQAVIESMNKPLVTSRNKRRKIANSESTGGDGGIGNKDISMDTLDNPPTEFLSSGNPLREIDYIDPEVYWKHIEQIRLAGQDIVTTVNKIVTMRNQTAITKSEVAYLVMLLREGMERFVPKENREPYVKWILENIPGVGKGMGVKDEGEV